MKNSKNQILNIFDNVLEIALIFGDHGITKDCTEGLSFVEFMALKLSSEHENLSVHEVGERLNFTKSGATRIINRLEKKHLVERKKLNKDHRVCCIIVTDEGHALMDKIIKNYSSYFKGQFDPCSDECINEMSDNLNHLMDKLIPER